MSNTDIFNILSEAIQEITGLDKSEISIEADIIEDLEIDPIVTFPLILRTVNQQLDIKLPLSNPEFVSELKKCETIAELVDLIEGESEF